MGRTLGDARDAEISRTGHRVRIAIYGTLRDYFFVLAAFALWQLRALHANKRISSISFYVRRVYRRWFIATSHVFSNR